MKLTFLPPDLNEEPQIIKTYPEDLRTFVQKQRPLLVVNAYRIIYYNGIDLYGFDMALDLIHSLKNKYPNIGLVIALADTSDTKYVESLRRQIEEMDLEDNIYFLVDQRILWPLFKMSDVMIRPTASDGFGVSVAEAIYFGSAAVASDVCARPDGTTLFESRNTEDFILKVQSVLEQKQTSRPVNLLAKDNPAVNVTEL